MHESMTTHSTRESAEQAVQAFRQSIPPFFHSYARIDLVETADGREEYRVVTREYHRD